METAVAGVKIVGPDDGREGFLGSIGVRFLIDGAEAGERFSLVEHPMSPRALAAPVHRHTREDEYSFVLEGRMGALLGDDVVEAGPGDLVFKPRNQWHTFWNAGDEPCRILEIISPAGFERFFQELSDMGGVLAAIPRRSHSSASATASRCSRRRSPACSSASGCSSASRSPAAGRCRRPQLCASAGTRTPSYKQVVRRFDPVTAHSENAAWHLRLSKQPTCRSRSRRLCCPRRPVPVRSQRDQNVVDAGAEFRELLEEAAGAAGGEELAVRPDDVGAGHTAAADDPGVQPHARVHLRGRHSLVAFVLVFDPGLVVVTGTVGRHDHAALPDCWEAHMAADEDQAVSADEEVVA